MDCSNVVPFWTEQDTSISKKNKLKQGITSTVNLGFGWMNNRFKSQILCTKKKLSHIWVECQSQVKKKEKSNPGSQFLAIEQSLAITKLIQDTQMDLTWKSYLVFPLSIETYKEMRTLVNRETSGFKNFP